VLDLMNGLRRRLRAGFHPLDSAAEAPFQYLNRFLRFGYRPADVRIPADEVFIVIVNIL
jgi:hypothetical protein